MPVVPDEGSARGYRVDETRTIAGADAIEPPTPGQPITYRTV